MFESFGTEPQRREQALLIQSRRIVGMGKKRFVAINTIVLGNGCFALLRMPILCNFWYGRTIDHFGKVILATVGLPLSMGIGLAFSLSMWRSWVRHTNTVE
jgi:hypothetical protein